MIFLILAGVVAVCNLLVWCLVRLHIPHTIALMIVGLLLGSEYGLPRLMPDHIELIRSLGNAGLLALMAVAGLRTSWRDFYAQREDAFTVASFSIFIPFLVTAFLLFKLDFSPLAALTVGIILSITAEGTNAESLLHVRKLHTRIGALIMGAGIMVDIIGLFLFVLLASLLEVGFFQSAALLSAAICVYLISMLVAGRYQLSSIERHPGLVKLESWALYLIIPFFHISVGFEFNANILSVNLGLVALLLILAVITKMLAAYVARFFLPFNIHQMELVGWAMNSRGAIELAIAFIALQNGLISRDIYSGIVIVALITTMTFPFVVRFMTTRYAHLMQ